nr:MAG TPA: hypothetical protein [Caudoviricetes sp.]
MLYSLRLKRPSSFRGYTRWTFLGNCLCFI